MSTRLVTLSDFAEILHFFPDDAIIAGGAVRDFFLGKQPKDIDVFRTYRDNPWNYGENLEPATPILDDQKMYRSGLGLLNINSWEYNGWHIQEMVVSRSPIEYIQDFDINLCKCLYDGALYFTPEFVDDVRNKTLTISKPGPKSKERAERINKKYGYTIIEN